MDYIVYEINDSSNEQVIIGALNNNLKTIESIINCNLFYGSSKIYTDDASKTQLLSTLFATINDLINEQITFEERDLVNITNEFKYNEILTLNDLKKNIIEFYTNKKLILNTVEGTKIYAKSVMQLKYLKLMDKKSIIFGIGAAGTGKTWVAVAYAVNLLKKNVIRKLVITRPVVEAGEKLGFLPGDLKEKIDPYLIPIYDALYEFLSKETTEKMIEKGVIEIAPLAYMRGRTLDNCFVILDEAQNTTRAQMKMFLTRLGFSSKMVITGDVTQIDLPNNSSCGLIEAVKLLKDIEEIGIIKFSSKDVMRHRVVTKIIEKYEEANND